MRIRVAVVILIIILLVAGTLIHNSESFKAELNFTAQETDAQDVEENRNISKPIGYQNLDNRIYDGSFSYHSSESNSQTQTIWECGFDQCNKSTLEQTYTICEDWWAPEEGEPDKCIRTSDGVNKVSVKSDRANHITAPLTQKNYSTSKKADELISNYRDGPIYHLTRPWNIEILNDSKMLISTRGGNIYYIDDQKVEREYNLEVEDGHTGSGLLGITKHPDFQQNNKIYGYYTYKEGYSRVSSFELGQDNLKNEEVLVDEIPGYKEHYGGRLEIGPNQHLYVTTGDAFSPEKANKSDYLGGKILRLELDGAIPEDNPWSNEVYAKGLRNPQGMAFHPENDTLMISQHGPWRRDEIRIIEKGETYSWPEPCQASDPLRKNQSQPLFCTQTYTLAPSGITIVDDPEHEWYGDMFVASLRGRHLHRFEFNDELQLEKNEVFYVSEGHNTTSRLRDVAFDQEGLWIIGDGQGITKISPG